MLEGRRVCVCWRWEGVCMLEVGGWICTGGWCVLEGGRVSVLEAGCVCTGVLECWCVLEGRRLCGVSLCVVVFEIFR